MASAIRIAGASTPMTRQWQWSMHSHSRATVTCCRPPGIYDTSRALSRTHFSKRHPSSPNTVVGALRSLSRAHERKTPCRQSLLASRPGAVVLLHDVTSYTPCAPFKLIATTRHNYQKPRRACVSESTLLLEHHSF